MLKNYLTTALRGLWKGRLYTVINIVGLAVGLAACLLILAHVRHELGYDRWIPDGERIYTYEVQAQMHATGGATYYYTTSPVGAVGDLPREVPGIAAATAIEPREVFFLKGDTPLELEVFAAPSGFFDFYPLEARTGDPRRALTEPGSIVLTAATAARLFDNSEAQGRTVRTMAGETWKVAAVVDPMPEQTHVAFDVLMALPPPSDDSGGWEWNRSRTVYLKLAEGTDIDAIRPQIEAVTTGRIFPPGYTGEPADNPVEVLLCALRDLHFLGGHRCAVYYKPVADPDLLAAFAGVGGVILALGAVNFANIALARSFRRTREVGLRKMAGASRAQIMRQFLGEAVLVAILALFVGAGLAEIAGPLFAALVGKAEPPALFDDPLTLAGALGLGLVAGLAGGAWPAFAGSRYRPVEMFGGETRRVQRHRLRTILVIGQFAVAIGLGIAALVVAGQIRFAQSAGLGFDARDVVVVRGKYDDTSGMPVLLSRLESETAVISAALAYGGPATSGYSFTDVAIEAGGEMTRIQSMRVGAAYFETLGMTVLRAEGAPPLDDVWRENTAMVNEAALEQLGLASAGDAIGRHLHEDQNEGEPHAREIVGVVGNFHTGVSMSPQPILFQPYTEERPPWFLAAKLAPGREAEALAAIDAAWREIVPDRPVDRYFAEQRLAAGYDDLRRTMRAFTVAAGLAIAIAALGLFGLAALAAETRTREIALRKTLGAGVPEILRLLLWQFTRPVLLANLIAWPAAAWYLRDWLEGFYLRIELTLWPFLLAGGAALAIALLTVAGHAIRVARTHPALALREE